MTDAAALDDHGVGTDQHIVFHNDGGSGGWLYHTGQDRTGSYVAVLAHGCPAPQNGTHVDHGALTHHGTDIQNGTHHNDGVFLNGHLLPDEGTGLDTGGDVLQVQHGNGGVAAAVFYFNMGEFLAFQHRTDVLPVAKDDLAVFSGRELVAVGESHRLLLPDINLDGGLLLRVPDVGNDFFRVHHSSRLLWIFVYGTTF